MGIIQTFTDLARFVGAVMTATRATNDLQKERDPRVISQLCETINAAREKANTNPTWGGFNTFGETKNPAWNKLNNFAEMTSQAARSFAKQDYEGAFEFAYARLELKDPASAFIALNLAVDALGQVKTKAIESAGQDEYQQKFGDREIEILAAVNRKIASSDPLGLKTTPKKQASTVSVSDPLHGISMGAAYLNFVGGDLATAGRLVDDSVTRSGAEPVLKREIAEPSQQLWFYDNLNFPMMQKFRSFLSERLKPAPAAPKM